MSIWLVFALCACAEPSATPSTPELIEASQDHLIIAWEGQASELEYWPLGRTDAVSVVSDEADTKAREVRIGGLEPGSLYSYRIRGAKEVYNAQTKPLASSLVSFVLFDGVSQDELLRQLVSDSPGFMMSLSVLSLSSFAELRPFVAVYDPGGNTAAYLRRQPNYGGDSGYRIDWGCLVLAVSDDPAYLQKQIDSLNPGYTLGLLTTEDSADSVDFGPLRKLTASASIPPAFALLRDTDKTKERGGVRFVGVKAPNTRYNVLVDPEFASMTELPGGIQIDLRPAPVSTKRTCAECRKLADKGAYRASIAAYVAFIESNRQNHLVDDAYFEVANIYDEKLFDFLEAASWYDQLVNAYPNSALTPFAKERLKYFRGFDPSDLPALEEFEKIRRVSFLAAGESAQDELIEQVLRKSDEARHRALSPLMLYWAANQLRHRDAPRAVALYRKLAVQYPDDQHAGEAVYAAAETLYESREYVLARESYRSALAVTPDRKHTILAQIERCDRNLRRRFLVWPTSIVVLGVLGTSSAYRQAHSRKQWKKSLAVFLGTALLLAIWAWTIREQFPSDTVLVSLAFGSAAIAGAAPSIVVPIALAAFRSTGMRVAVAGLLVSLFSLSGLYLLVWSTFEHYLAVFGL
jgi:tetratricopeptide (TPR) repeat protein